MPNSQFQNVLRFVRRMVEFSRESPSTDADLLNHFLIHNDEGAFAAIVERHGAMVWGVCRRFLHCFQDAEDCFQATFLILSRKARTLQNGDSLGAWLHRVAYRLARRSQAMNVKRRTGEGRAAAMNPITNEREKSWKELREHLDQELEHLPHLYRIPLVLCYLEGKSNAQVAQELGCPLGTIKGRLSRGRELLRRRLEKRGLSFTAAGLVILITEHASSAAVPGLLLMSTASAASAFVTGKAVKVSGRTLALANSLLKAATIGILLKSGLISLGIVLASVGTVLIAAMGEFKGTSQGAISPTTVDKRNRIEEPKIKQRAGAEQNRLDAFGDPLPAGAVSRLGTSRLRPAEPLNSLRITPDGKSIVTRGLNLRTWDLLAGNLLHELEWKRESSLFWPKGALSPDAKLVAVPGQSGIELFSVATGAHRSTIGMGRFAGAYLSPDGKQLVALKDERPYRVELFSVDDGKLIWSSGHGEYPLSLAEFSPDGKTVVAAGWGQFSSSLSKSCIRILDARTGAERRVINLDDSSPRAIAISPDGRFAAAIYVGSVSARRRPEATESPIRAGLRVWDLLTGNEIIQIKPPASNHEDSAGRYFTGLIFSPDSKSILTTGNIDNVIAWDLGTGNELRRFGRGLRQASNLTLTPDGKILVALASGLIRVVAIATGADLAPHLGDSASPLVIACNNDGSTVVSASPFREGEGASVIYWNSTTGKPARRIEGLKGRVRALTPDGSMAIVEPVDPPKSVIIRDLVKSADMLITTDFKWTNESAIAMSADGKLLALAAPDKNTTQLIDIKSGAIVRTITDADMSVRHLRFTADGARLFAFGPDQSVRIWNVAQGTLEHQYRPERVPDLRPKPSPVPPQANAPRHAPYEVALSPDGKMIATADMRNLIMLNEANGAGKGRRIDVKDTRVSKVAFSADSKMLAWTAWDDPIIRLLDVATGKEVHRLVGHRGTVLSLTFSPDGQRLISNNTDHTALVWDLSWVAKNMQ